MTAILLVTYQYTIAVTALDAIYEDLDDFCHGLLNPCRCLVQFGCIHFVLYTVILTILLCCKGEVSFEIRVQHL